MHTILITNCNEVRDWSSADVATPTLVSIEIVEIGDDHGHWQRDGEHAGDHTQRSDEPAEHSDRCDVAIADRRHGNDRPPESARDRRELGIPFADLGVVGGRAKDHHGNQQEEEEHSELVKTGLDGESENTKTLTTVTLNNTIHPIQLQTISIMLSTQFCAV